MEAKGRGLVQPLGVKGDGQAGEGRIGTARIAGNHATHSDPSGVQEAGDPGEVGRSGGGGACWRPTPGEKEGEEGGSHDRPPEAGLRPSLRGGPGATRSQLAARETNEASTHRRPILGQSKETCTPAAPGADQQSLS